MLLEVWESKKEALGSICELWGNFGRYGKAFFLLWVSKEDLALDCLLNSSKLIFLLVFFVESQVYFEFTKKISFEGTLWIILVINKIEYSFD
jgi:hypothetical protein